MSQWIALSVSLMLVLHIILWKTLSEFEEVQIWYQCLKLFGFMKIVTVSCCCAMRI